MNFQTLFSNKKLKKNILKCLLKFSPSIVMIKVNCTNAHANLDLYCFKHATGYGLNYELQNRN